MPEWTCPRCGRTFLQRNARHSCTSQAPEALFARYPEAIPLYRAARKAIESFGPVEVEATRTQVAFRARKRFAFLWIPEMSLHRGPRDLYLTFDLARPLASKRVKEVVEPRRGLFTHHVRFAKRSDLDAEVRAWLREAYARAGGEPAKARPARRPRLRMPADVRRALDESGLAAAYRARPPYQRNDYVGWIARAKRPETREKRIAQMLGELAEGRGYMGMAWKPKEP